MVSLSELRHGVGNRGFSALEACAYRAVLPEIQPRNYPVERPLSAHLVVLSALCVGRPVGPV